MLTCVLGVTKSRIDVAFCRKKPDAFGAAQGLWNVGPRVAPQHPLT